MSDYMRGVVYMIHHKDDLELYEPYIGSTFNFDERMSVHKGNCNNPNKREYNYKLYQHIRANGGWDSYEVKIIEYYDCKDKRELEKREDEIMLNFHNRLNEKRACRNLKEYYQDNKDKLLEKAKQYQQDNKEKIAEKHKKYREDNKNKIAEWHKQHRQDNKEKLAEKYKKYREDNKDKIAEYKKQYRQDNKDKLAEKYKKYREDNKDKLAEQAKQYRQDNKDKITDCKKEWYEANKDKILERQKQKVICDRCGSEVRKNGLAEHKKSKKCINFICQKHTFYFSQ